MSAALGPIDAAALQPLMAAFQTLRTWQQRLSAASSTPNSNGHAATAAPQANGHTAAASQLDEFGADLTVHTSRLAEDPDAAVLAMCGVSPGSPTGASRCSLAALPAFGTPRKRTTTMRLSRHAGGGRSIAIRCSCLHISAVSAIEVCDDVSVELPSLCLSMPAEYLLLTGKRRGSSQA